MELVIELTIPYIDNPNKLLLVGLCNKSIYKCYQICEDINKYDINKCPMNKSIYRLCNIKEIIEIEKYSKLTCLTFAESFNQPLNENVLPKSLTHKRSGSSSEN